MTNYRDIPYQFTQFNKYYEDYLAKANATIHLNHKSGEVMQVDWVGDTAAVIDTDTGEVIPAYVFVATLPYSGYSYVEAFFSMNQEAWTTAHVNAYKYFGGVTRIIQCDNLKTGVQKHGKDDIVLTNPTRNWLSTTAPPFCLPESVLPRTRPLLRVLLVSSLPLFWQPCGTVSFSPCWN